LDPAQPISNAQPTKPSEAHHSSLKTAVLTRKRLAEVAFAILVGLVAFAVVILTRGFTALSDLDLGVQDRVDKLYVDSHPSPVAPPFVLVDLSQDDVYRLGYPAVFPRDLLAELLKVAAEGGPRLIVVDVDISWAGEPEQEAKLVNQLQALAKPGAPPILFVRQLLRRPDPKGTDLVRATRYDAIVDSAPNLFWVSALGQIDGDGVIRRYATAPLVCRAGRTERLPSVQLTGCLALTPRLASAVDTLTQVRRQFDAQAPCTKDDGPGSDLPPRLSQPLICNGHEWPTDEDAEHHAATAEIGYDMSWEGQKNRSRPQVAVNGQMAEEARRIDVFKIAGNAMPLDAQQTFGGKVVVIGSSAQEFGDLRQTPLDVMPGLMVVANAMKSGLDVGSARHFNLALSAGLTMVLSAISYFIWVLIHDVVPHHVRPIAKLVLDPLLAGLWFLLIGFLIPDARVLLFLLPQSVVLAALTGVRSLREERSELRAKSSKGDAANALTS